MRFGLVGGICFVLEFSSYILFIDVLEIHYSLANLISLILANVLNYYLSKAWVFSSGKYSLRKEMIVFYIVSALAVVFNQLLVWMFIDLMFMDYRIAKISAIGIVMFFNFVVKKYFVFQD